MALVLLIRHATTEATGRVIYGRAEGFPLDERGLEQARRLAERLAPVPIAAIYSSPLQRCRETAAPVARAKGLDVRIEEGLNELDVGDWAGRTIRQLSRTRTWRLVQATPSRARFPGGESFGELLGRAVEAVERLADAHRPRTIALFTHGDVIRVLLAHYAGTHLDLFQRLVVLPASISAVALGDGRPAVVCTNDTGDLPTLLGDAGRRRRRPARRVRG